MSLRISSNGVKLMSQSCWLPQIDSMIFALFICCALVTFIVGLFLVFLIFIFHRGGIVAVGRLEEEMWQVKEYHQNISHDTKMEENLSRDFRVRGAEKTESYLIQANPSVNCWSV